MSPSPLIRGRAVRSRLSWFHLPVGLLLVLQRGPAVRLLAVASEEAVFSRAVLLLRATFTTGLLGAMHSLAGATTFIVSRPNPITGTVGQPITPVSFTYNGTPTSPGSFQVTGSLPPGLAFIPAPVFGTIPSGTPAITGTPTQAGQFSLFVQGFNPDGLTNGVLQPLNFEISGAAAVAPTITVQPQSQTGTVGNSVTLAVGTTGTPAPTYQWFRAGVAIPGATNSTLTLENLQPADVGDYTVLATNAAGSATSAVAIVGIDSSVKLVGPGTLFPDIPHPNGNIFDQILLEGPAATVTADPGQVLRMSYLDLTDDIVQVEFSGPGALTLVLDGASGPMPPAKYIQDTLYMKGHARIVLSGATKDTHVSVFSVGFGNAVNKGLFREGEDYDGRADIASLSITSATGAFGGIRGANTSYLGTEGLVGVHAPGVNFDLVFVHDIAASDNASPMLLLGSCPDVRITGGDLLQPNGRAVRVSGIAQLKFADGVTSHFVDLDSTPLEYLSARPNQAVLEDNGVDVTSQIVVGPTP